MQRDIPIGFGAGLAAALLVLAIAGGSPFGLALVILAPLPITLVTLGWGSRAGLIAAMAAMAILAGLTTVRFGLAFGVSMALPAWGLAHLVIGGTATTDGQRGPLSLGSIVAVAALLSAFSALFATISVGSSYESVVAALEQAFTVMFKDVPATPDFDPSTFIHTFSRIVLPLSAAIGAIVSVCGLWLAGRIALMSGRLPLPWPDVAALRLPQWVLFILGASCAVSLLPGTLGFSGQLLLCALIGAFVIQGFAVAHYATRGMAARPMILGAVYLLLLFLNWLLLALMALLGLADLFFNIRRLPSGRSPSTPSTS